MSEELKPCPFCGSPAKITHCLGEFWIQCEDAKCRGGEKLYVSPELAAKHWNTRAAPVVDDSDQWDRLATDCGFSPCAVETREEFIWIVKQTIEQAGKAVPVMDAAMIRRASESVARDDEGEFPPLFELIGYSGENKTRTVIRAALMAALGQA